MDLKVSGGQTLNGTVTPSGNKNAAVALLPATILFTEPVVLENMPDIPDIHSLIKVMQGMGSRIEWDTTSNRMTVDNSNFQPNQISPELASSMKGMILLWGPLIARFKNVMVQTKTGGCTLGVRPAGPQYQALEDLGVKLETVADGVRLDGTNATAREVWLEEMSPTITENLVMLATGLVGTTKIVGAASEPHVQDLCRMLMSAGVEIKGLGSSVLVVTGVSHLNPVTFKVSSDHHEIATYLALGAITGGEVRVNDAIPEYFRHINLNFEKLGVHVEYEGNTAVVRSGQSLQIKETLEGQPQIVRSQPWPGFPVDILPLFIPIALASPTGQAMFHNWMYEGGLFWTSELKKMGANIVMCDPHRVIVTGGKKLKAAKLEAPYIIRAVIAMLMSTLIAQGESTILNVDAMYRAHPHFVDNLRSLGAQITEMNENK